MGLASLVGKQLRQFIENVLSLPEIRTHEQYDDHKPGARYNLEVVPAIFEQMPGRPGGDCLVDLSAWNDVRSEIISIAKRLQATRVKVEPGVEAEVPAAVPAGVKVEPGAKVEPGVKAEVKAEPKIRVIKQERKAWKTPKAPAQSRRDKRRQFVSEDKRYKIQDTAAVREMPRELLETLVVSLKARARELNYQMDIVKNYNNLNRQKKARQFKRAKTFKSKHEALKKAQKDNEWIKFKGRKKYQLHPRGLFTLAVFRNRCLTAAQKFGLSQRVDTSRYTICRAEIRAWTGFITIQQLFFETNEKELQKQKAAGIKWRARVLGNMGDCTNANIFHKDKLRSAFARGSYLWIKTDGTFECSQRCSFSDFLIHRHNAGPGALAMNKKQLLAIGFPWTST